MKGSVFMSNREFAKSLIDQIPENKLFFAIAYLQGISVPDEIPNAETQESMEELERGGGTVFTGSTADLFTELMKE